MARELAITVKVNKDQARRGLAEVEQDLGKVSGRAKTTVSDLDKISATLSRVSASALRVGTVLTAGVTLPILAVGGAAIKMAMNAVESENLFEVSFGNMAKAAREW